MQKDTNPISVNERVDLWHRDHLCHHAAQPTWVDKVEVPHLKSCLVVVEQDTTLMEEAHSLSIQKKKKKN